uniref:Putative conserved plasma membrane protein n=1 Tax=Amblyomma aureolatum TaxID=187763 RepID=A0A1E1X7S9_9ACAR
MHVYSHHPFLALAFVAAAAVLFIYPFVLRFNVYKDTLVAMAVSDTIPVRERISTVWCSGQELVMNHSFDAHVFRDSDGTVTRPLGRTLELSLTMTVPKQTYEYWGFYFVAGSNFTVSVCSRLSGAAFSLIRGSSALGKCLTALETKRRGLDESDEDADSDEAKDGESSPESDDQSSTISSSEGLMLNETLGISVCNNALFHVPLRWTYSCGTAHDRRDHRHNISYAVAASDFYYVFFASNPPLYVTPNTIVADFYLDRMVYDVSKSFNPETYSCTNVTNCSLPLDFMSNEYVVVDMHGELRNSSRINWTSDVLTSRCLPRKGVYFIFYFVFGLVVMVAAFQG